MMILYNFRYRGPYEYDKFILNILQLYNEVILLEQQLQNNSINQIIEAKKEFDAIFDILTNGGSLSENILLLKYQLE